MKFAHPWLAWAALPLACALVLHLRRAHRARRAALDRFAGDASRSWAATGRSTARQRLDEALLVITVLALTLALARPLRFVQDERSELQGLPYIVVLDASRSMLCTDVKPSRYAAATNGLHRLFEVAGADRIGLVTFAGVAYLNAPLTYDANALKTTLNYLDPEAHNDQGSSIGAALERAARYFVSNNIPQRLAVLISDGEDPGGNPLEIALRLQRQFGLKVCTVGVGTSAGARVPAGRFAGGRTAKNTFGQEVISRMNEGNLQRIATATGGRFYRLGDNGEGLVQLRHEFLKPLAEQTARQDLRNYRDWFQLPLALGCLAGLARLVWSPDRRSQPLRWSALMPQPKKGTA